MAEKRRYTVSLPDHVADEIERLAKKLGATPTEYAGDVIRWWFGQGRPPIRPDEQELRSAEDTDPWNLNPLAKYVLTGDAVVQRLMQRLGVPNLFAGMTEFDNVHSFVAFDNHPSHWLVLHLWKGHPSKSGNGLLFEAEPKSSTSAEAMLSRLKSDAKRIGVTQPVTFSQLPLGTKPAPASPPINASA